MKKHVLFLAGSALLLASCGSNNNNQQQTQAQIEDDKKPDAFERILSGIFGSRRQL